MRKERLLIDDFSLELIADVLLSVGNSFYNRFLPQFPNCIKTTNLQLHLFIVSAS